MTNESETFNTAQQLEIVALGELSTCVDSVTQCSTLCDPTDRSPTRLFCLCESPSKNTEAWCHFLLQGVFPMRTEFKVALVVKHPPANAGNIRDVTSIPVGKIPWRTVCKFAAIFFWENLLDREAWRTTVHEVAKSWKGLRI